jgi:drug/metabolite transporter (DMT)-like permease
MLSTLPLILLCVFINTAAQILLKQGMNQLGHFDFSLPTILNLLTKIAFNPYIISGMFCYVASVFAWLLVLSRTPVSYAYPMISLGYITTCLAAVILFDEVLTLPRIVGIFVIIAGVYLVSRSG